jgi:hypothetical protein
VIIVEVALVIEMKVPVVFFFFFFFFLLNCRAVKGVLSVHQESTVTASCRKECSDYRLLVCR